MSSFRHSSNRQRGSSTPGSSMWPRRRRRRRPPQNGPVGTEKIALQQMERNRKIFKYPSEGFVQKIEYSLLYNMVSSPNVYPEDVVQQHIQDEDLYQYLVVDAKQTSSSSSRQQDDDEEGEEEPDVVSYAQLSAILALSAEKFPPPADEDNNVPQQQAKPKQSISQTLCKKVLQLIINYAEEHDLDRQHELRELLDPVERHAVRRNDRKSLQLMLPFYVGYTASLLTLNPLPMLAGAAAMTAMGDGGIAEETQNVQSIQSETNRRADIERTSLLDETDHDF